MDTIKVGIFVGSIRKGSFSRIVAEYVAGLFPSWIEPEIMDIGSLPLYNQDFDSADNPPEEYAPFREAVHAQSAFLFVTPEHNRSVPAALKNAIDVASRPYGHSCWDGKPGAIISDSPGAMGAFGANHHLRQSLTFLNVYTMQQPECYIGNITACIDDEGMLTSERTQQFLLSFTQDFCDWIERFVK